MEMYEILNKIGNGAFGDVYRGKHKFNGEIVAIKRLRFQDNSQLQVLPSHYFNEIESLRLLEHQNIVKLLEVIPDGTYISLVMEYVQTDLLTIIRSHTERFHDADIRGLMRMLLKGVGYCHSKSILHRDLKPGNLLVDAKGVLKLSDFGLATIYVGPNASYSHQVATRWYRAPELLFGGRNYDISVDMWSVGAIFGELLQNVPLFAGQNDIDQISRIFQVLGNPEDSWPEIRNLPDYNKISFPIFEPKGLDNLIPYRSKEAIDLLSKLLALNPAHRLSADEALLHPYLVYGPVRSYFSRKEVQANIKTDTCASSKDKTTADSKLTKRELFLQSLNQPLQF